MIKEIVDMQRNSFAVCAVVKDEERHLLSQSIEIEANIKDGIFFNSNADFLKKIEVRSKYNDLCYLVVRNIDSINENKQEKFYQLVKDRNINNFNLPLNCIIVLTVLNKEGLKNISPNLYQFCVVAFKE